MFGLGTILSVVQLGVKVGELFRGSGPEKKIEAMKTITDNPYVTIKGNPELERLIEDELIPLLVRLAHLTGAFSKRDVPESEE